ncbi:universal stress protein [Formosa sp. PL04]|uniref:universal stress protein n=1 Tax=Formosa sp. PL04 TaxID=3081755 RepID=UPI002980D8B5|nr:universal stress protein [Formosa sp. PL04]MDW5290791.1 universal stress protein [Formosa sp. PL04]
MNTIKKILVPVDLSDTALHTVLYALEFAKEHQSHVEVFYSSAVPLVYGESAYFGDGFGADNAAMMMQAYQLENENAKEKLELFKVNLEKHIKEKHLSLVPISYNFEFGSAMADINVEAETNNSDLIICGIHDHEDPSRLVKGISEKLLRNATTPVIAVPEQDHYTPIKNVAYATNFHKHTVEEVEQFLSFIKPFGAKTHCVHLGDMLNEQQQMDANLKPYFKDNDAVDFHIVSSTTLNDGLEAFIKRHNIDALALHPHRPAIWNQLFGKNRLESILQHTNVPVITVH